MKTDFEYRFYKGEFVVADERSKAYYRDNDKNLGAMKEFLGQLGMFTNHQTYLNLIEDESVRQITEIRGLEDESDFEVLKQDYLKESRRPLPLEGHLMTYIKDRLIVCCGMRHTLPFNDIYFVTETNLSLQPGSLSPQDRVVHVKRNLLPFING